jgi:DNA mismatch repair protein MutL
MSKIILLNEDISNLIAAGEVVENMASVVKELVENAIDAQSTQIDVSLQDEGLKEIRVTDNGTGMSQADLKLSVKRHATSKIKTSHDLFHIQSLGFRGEALPSIAAVSTLEMISGTEMGATKMVVKNGEVKTFEPYAQMIGTRISVQNLFYNTPARLKHLKATSTELSYISDYVNKMALSHPDIAFSLTNNNHRLFTTNGDGDVLKVLSNIYSIDVVKNMRYFEGENAYFKIKGYLTKPFIHRSTRKHMSIIANHRMIKNSALLKAISNGYNTYLPIGKYPIVALFIEMDPLLIDVNIHPQKLEVKLTEERLLRSLITQTINDQLKTLDLIPNVKKTTTKKPEYDQLDLREPSSNMTVASPPPTYEPDPKTTDNVTIKDTMDQPVLTDVKTNIEKKTSLSRLSYIGQYLGTYLICQNDNGLYLIDQHAAAERIRYEQYFKAMGQAKVNQTALLVPLKLDVSNDEIIAINDYVDTFNALGVQFDVKENALYATHVPYWFLKGFESVYLDEMIQQVLNDEETSVARLRDPLAKELSCKHSIKANHYINQTEIERLLRDLEQCDNPYTCPHGRPVTIRFSQAEIEKMFWRIQS